MINHKCLVCKSKRKPGYQNVLKNGIPHEVLYWRCPKCGSANYSEIEDYLFLILKNIHTSKSERMTTLKEFGVL